MSDVLGAGVVGLGYAGWQHALAYARHPKTALSGAVTSSPSKLRQINDQTVFTTQSLDELLQRDDIQIISICTPDTLHADQVVKAVEAGKHVLCEKPLAPSAEECERIVKAAAASDRKVMTGQILRFAPQFQSIYNLASRGELGDLFFSEADYLHNLQPFLQGWRADPDHKPNLVLGGGCHPIDLLRWIVGEVEEVHAYANGMALKGSAYPNDCIVISLKFARGCIGKVLISGGCKRPYALNLSLYGTDGTLQNDKIFLDRIDHLEDWMSLPLPVKEEYPYYYEEVDHLVTCIEGDQNPLVDAVEGAKTVGVCLAADLSIKENRPVKVAELDSVLGV